MTTVLLFATHFTVPVTLLATVDDVGAGAWPVVVVELVLDDEHPVITSRGNQDSQHCYTFHLVGPFFWARYGIPTTRRSEDPSSVSRGLTGPPVTSPLDLQPGAWR